MKDKIIAIISKAAKIEPALLLEEPAKQWWDSLTHLEIVFILEETFDIQLSPENIASMRSVNAIMEVLSPILEDKK